MKNKQKTKIAIFHNLKSGGAKRIIKDITNELSKNSQVDIYKPTNKHFSNFINYLFYIHYDLPKIHRKIAQQINKKDYNLVFINHDYLTKSPYILNYLKGKTIYLCHEEPREFYSDKRYFNSNFKNKIINTIRYPLKKIDKKNVNKANIILTNSNFSKNKLEKIYNRKFEILKLGIDSNKFKFSNKNDKYYITIGSTSKFKGVDFIINSISKLSNKLQFPLYIVGSKGRDHSYIIKLAKKKNIKLKLLNNLSDENLVDKLQKANLLLACAINEPFGLSILESISCGTKVIAINEGGYKEILRNEDKVGSLVKRNINDFSKEITTQINSKISKKSRNEFISKWDIKETVKQLKSYI